MKCIFAVILSLLFIALLVAGCINNDTGMALPSNQSAGKQNLTTTINASAIKTLPPKPTPGKATKVAAGTPTKTTTVVTADPTDPSNISFLHYSDGNFSVEYPQRWSITNASYSAPACSAQSSGCSVSTITISGTFYGDLNGIITRFTSADKKLVFEAYASDYHYPMTGNYRLVPGRGWAEYEINVNHRNYASDAIMADFSSTRTGNGMTGIYFVNVPGGSLSYTRYTIVTLHHVYQFTFSSDTATFNRYAALRDTMAGTIAVSDTS